MKSPFYTKAPLMAPPTAVKDILLFHKIDRAVYDKFVTHGMERDIARNAVALFMWLEQLHIDMIGQIAPITDLIKIWRLIDEANAVLHCLRPDDDGLNNNTGIPTITSLSKNRLNIHVFKSQYKDVIVRGVASILDGVGRVVFDDHMYELLRAYEEAAPARAELRAVMPVVPPELATLYDFAATEPLIEDVRSIFITFKKEFLITLEEILKYFTERWGDCIDKLMTMESTRINNEGTTTLTYGRIVFKSDTYISLLLNGERVVIYNINGRQLWARKYVPWLFDVNRYVNTLVIYPSNKSI